MKRKIELSLNEAIDIAALTLNKQGKIPSDIIVTIDTHWDFHNTNNSTVTISWEE